MQPELYDEFMRCFAKLDFTPNIIQDATTKHTTLSLVRYGIGLAIVPQSAAMLAPKKIVFKPIQNNSLFPQVEHYAVWRKEENQPVFQLVLEACKPIKRPI
jgi:DNA-binding transcriptional LysR family regulator